MEKFVFENEDRRQYINLLQDNINRMAANSANCKTWLVSIVSALLAVQAALKEMTFVLLIGSISLIILFYILDSYYLGLERRFIMLEKTFVDHLKSNDNYHDDMYNLNPQKTGEPGDDVKFTLKAMKSFSTWPFYGILLLCNILIFIYAQLCL